MYYPVNEAEHAHNRLNDRLSKAEQNRLIRSFQVHQSHSVNHLHSQLASWVDLIRSSRNYAHQA